MSDRSVSDELAEEIRRGGWMYEWHLAPGVATPLIGPNLRSVHTTRLELIEPACRAAIRAAGPGAKAIDLACNESIAVFNACQKQLKQQIVFRFYVVVERALQHADVAGDILDAGGMKAFGEKNICGALQDFFEPCRRL